MVQFKASQITHAPESIDQHSPVLFETGTKSHPCVGMGVIKYTHHPDQNEANMTMAII